MNILILISIDLNSGGTEKKAYFETVENTYQAGKAGEKIFTDIMVGRNDYIEAAVAGYSLTVTKVGLSSLFESRHLESPIDFENNVKFNTL